MIFQNCSKFHSPNGLWNFVKQFWNITCGIYATYHQNSCYYQYKSNITNVLSSVDNSTSYPGPWRAPPNFLLVIILFYNSATSLITPSRPYRSICTCCTWHNYMVYIRYNLYMVYMLLSCIWCISSFVFYVPCYNCNISRQSGQYCNITRDHSLVVHIVKFLGCGIKQIT